MTTRMMLVLLAILSYPTLSGAQRGGDYIVTSIFTGDLLAVDHKTGQAAVLASGWTSTLNGVAIDSQRNLIVTDSDNNSLVILYRNNSTNPPTYARQTIAFFPPGSYPEGVVIDSNGNYIVTDYAQSRLFFVDHNTPLPHSVTTIVDAGGLGPVNGPVGLAIDLNGDYVVSSTSPILFLVDSTTHTVDPFSSPALACPLRVTVDSSGNYIVSDICTGNLSSVNRVTHAATTIAATFSPLSGVAIDSNGDYIVTDVFGQRLLRIDHATHSITQVTSFFCCEYPVDVAVIPMTPLEAMRELQSLVDSLGLSRGLTMSLDAKLQSIAAEIQRSNFAAAQGELTAFIQEINAQSTNMCGSSALLISAAQAVLALLGPAPAAVGSTDALVRLRQVMGKPH